MRKFLPHIGVSAVSVIAGALIGFTASPNYMAVHVDPFGKLNLAPKNGDVIQFDGLNEDWGKYDVAIKFTNSYSNPCVPDPLSKGLCVVTYPNPAGTYLYTCADNSGKSVCDPNMGPGSGTGGKSGGGAGGSGIIKTIYLKIVAQLKVSTLRFLDSIETTDTLVLPTGGGASSGSGSPALEKIQVQVSCDGVKTDPTQVSLNPIQVNVGGAISWGDGSGPTGFTLSDLSAVCSKITTGKICSKVIGTSGTDYPYTATDNNCAKSQPLTIHVN